jgi:hypothetical protein
MVSTAIRPTEAQVEIFVTKLRAYRDTLPDDEQRLLNSMFFAAMGKHDQRDRDIHGYWVAYTPGYSYGGWYSSPWGTAYGSHYTR